MTINVTDTVGANNTIVLDGSSKIVLFAPTVFVTLTVICFP
jgi:hypothetical protein